jgi:UDP-N-acetyl-D-glucosamine dehydrogenase
MNEAAKNLLDRIRAKNARVGVIGLGYVGLPLAVEFALAGFSVTGFDVDPNKVRAIGKDTAYIPTSRRPTCSR